MTHRGSFCKRFDGEGLALLFFEQGDHSKDENKIPSINDALCKGCGTCVAACPSGSIKQNLFEDEEIISEIEGLLVS